MELELIIGEDLQQIIECFVCLEVVAEHDVRYGHVVYDFEVIERAVAEAEFLVVIIKLLI